MQLMEVNKKKIFYCVTKGVWGGAQRYVYDLATTLPKEIYDVAVILGEEGTLHERLKDSGIKTFVLGQFTRDIKIWKDFLGLIKLAKIFKKERPDIIHVNSSKMGLIGTVAGRIAGVPKIVFTGHAWAFNEDRSKLQKRILYFLHKLTIKLADVTIVVSATTQRQIPVNKTVVIKNGIEEIDFVDKESARTELRKNLTATADIDGRTWVGTISELHKNKGLKYIIEALYSLKMERGDEAPIPLLIVIGEGERREKLQERINRYGLQNDIFLIGRVENASSLVKAFDIFTLTSITEALPYVILEAGQAGLPIIASAVGGIPEIIDDMDSGILVRPKEPEEIKKSISYLIDHPDKMADFGRKIRQKVLEKFNKEEMVKETIKLYN
jgi:glycosyltransferase involved in cell wall biosynthesis